MALQTDGATGNASVLRKEDPRLVTGTGAFSADWYASLVLSSARNTSASPINAAASISGCRWGLILQ